MDFSVAVIRAGDEIIQVINEFRRFVPFHDVMDNWMPALDNQADSHLPDVVSSKADDGIFAAFPPAMACVELPGLHFVEA